MPFKHRPYGSENRRKISWEDTAVAITFPQSLPKISMLRETVIGTVAPLVGMGSLVIH